MAAAAATKLFTAESLRSAARQSEDILLVPLSLRRAIKKFLRERELAHMRRKVILLSESFERVKEANLQITASSASRDLVDDPLRRVGSPGGRSSRRTATSDSSTLRRRRDRRLRLLLHARRLLYATASFARRMQDFSPARVLDFGAGPGSALWAMREVWPWSLESVNLVEPSKSMQRASQSLLQVLDDPNTYIIDGYSPWRILLEALRLVFHRVSGHCR